MYASTHQMKSWIEIYGKFFLYAIETGDSSNTLEKARWLADLFARRQMDDQFGGGIKPNGMDEIQVICERVFLFGVSIDIAMHVSMENLIDARRLVLETRITNNLELGEEPYGEEIVEALREILVNERESVSDVSLLVV